MIFESERPEIAISLISQFLYCNRRAALIVLYSEWGDNEHTVSGTIEHERVHEEGVFTTGSAKTYHSLRVNSDIYGLVGVCDRVDYEFEIARYIPIEFKHGKRRSEIEYEAQLCAQVLCLEEMHDCEICVGYLFFMSEKRRKEVAITKELRTKTIEAINGLREIIKSGVLPLASRSAKCRECSLVEICLPQSPKGCRGSEYLKSIEVFAQGGAMDHAGGDDS